MISQEDASPDKLQNKSLIKRLEIITSRNFVAHEDTIPLKDRYTPELFVIIFGGFLLSFNGKFIILEIPLYVHQV